VVAALVQQYFDGHGELRWDTMDIMQNYLKGWFWIDTLSALPIDHIVKATGGSGNLRLIKLLRMIRPSGSRGDAPRYIASRLPEARGWACAGVAGAAPPLALVLYIFWGWF
jgi:hypothetical protein